MLRHFFSISSSLFVCLLIDSAHLCWLLMLLMILLMVVVVAVGVVDITS